MTLKKQPTIPHNKAIDEAASAAVKVIADASLIAAKKIADAAKEAHEVVSDAAATSVRVLHLKSADDHDLLIQLGVRMEGLKDDIKELRDGTTKRISDLEIGRATKTALATVQEQLDNLCKEVHGEREQRMRSLENKADRFWITIGLYSLFIAGLAAIMVIHIFQT